MPPKEIRAGGDATKNASVSSRSKSTKAASANGIKASGDKCTVEEIVTMLPQNLYKSATDGKLVLTLKGADGVRKLIVPGPEPTVHPVYFDKIEFCRLAKQAKVLTAAEKLNLQEAAEAAKRQLAKESVARKEHLSSFDKYREKSVRLGELEADAERKAAHLLARARELRQESEDEVKTANRLIIGTKCHAIRTAQVAEKRLIAKELEEEERRLDQMMEQQRMLGLKEEEKQKEEEAVKNQQYLQALLHQIQEAETERIHEAERKEEESRLMNEAAMQVQLEELQVHHKKIEEQAETRKFLAQVNEQLKYFQDLEQEEKRQAELKVQKFMADKAAREAAREQELRQIKLAKEVEIARMRAAQERMAALKGKQDDLKALRTQDEVERAWRQKEKEEALKKALTENEMKKVRAEQVSHRRSMQALEIVREKQQFERIIQNQRMEAEKERLDQLKRLGDMESYRMAILKQINERERERIRERKLKFEEGVALRTEEEQRQRDLKLTLKRKIEELRAKKVPEVHIKEVQRRLKLNG